MPVVAIASQSHCHQEEVARAVAERLECDLVSQDLLSEAAANMGISESRLRGALTGHPSFLSRLRRDREKGIIHLRAVLAEKLQQESLVQLGLGTYLVPAAITHVLKVALIGEQSYRLENAKQHGIPAGQGRKLLERDDADAAVLPAQVAAAGPWDTKLFDLRVPMHEHSVEQAAELISSSALAQAVRPNAKSLQAAIDFKLAAQVNLALLRAGHDYCETEANGSRVTVVINRDALRRSQLEREIDKIARDVAGVTEVEIKAGKDVNKPNIYRQFEFEIPSKVLVVDDEKDYALTLSERLQMRDFLSSVAHDGMAALAQVEKEEPDVMVLDLRMPGIDGIEVLRRIRREHPSIQVIIVTGHGTERDERLAKELGAFAYLQKPINVETLAQTMRKAVEAASREAAEDEG